jgi:radical SAM superfamily enzyme YgiQ (UPF0313 family)
MIYLLEPPTPYLIENKFVPSWGLLYLREFLLSKGIECKIVEPYRKEDILLEDGAIWGIGACTPQFIGALEYAKYIKNNTRDSTIIIGGPHITAVIGEPHITAVNGDGKNGLFDKCIVGGGELQLYNFITGEHSTFKSLDDYPFPRISKEEMELYGQYRKFKAINIVTSRGCPFDCFFCANRALWGEGTKYHSIDYVKEMADYYKSIGFTTLRLCDDSFTLNKKRMFELAKYFHNKKIEWQCQSRAEELMDDEKVELMIKLGCTETAVGVESGDQGILDRCNKRTTVEKVKAGMINAHNKGLPVRAYILLGLPGETRETLEKTKEFINTVPATSYTISIFVPYPGTEIAKRPQDFGITIESSNGWDDYVGIGNLVAQKSIIKEMKPLQEEFENIGKMVIDRSTFGKSLRSVGKKVEKWIS